MEQHRWCINAPYVLCVREREVELTSGFRLDTRTVHLSFVPLIPGGSPPPKAAAIAAALPIYNEQQEKKSSTIP